MDEAVGAITKYIDFFVLGAIAFLAISTPFKPFSPLLEGWKFLLYRCLPEAILRGESRPEQTEQAGASNSYGRERPSDRTIQIIQVGLAGAFLFALFYFAGIAVNGFGHSRLDGAHMLVIERSHSLVAKGDGQTSAPFELYLRPLPFWNSAKENERKAYADDAKAQLRWSICDPTSYEAMNGGTTIKHLRLVRGAIGITFLVFFASLISLFAWWVRNRRKPVGTPEEIEKHAAKHKDHLVWARWSLVGSLAVYVGMLIPMYWNIEMNTHTTVAAVFGPLREGEYALGCKRTDFEFAIREKGKYPFVGEKDNEPKDTEGEAPKPKPKPKPKSS